MYKIDEDKAIVQTVDIITPVVDDPFYYGQIAAANSLSDIFAMGAKVLTAMNVVGFDGCHHSPQVLKEILRGGESKVKECGGSIVGGHTIKTPEMLYGLSVTGLINPNKIYKNNTSKIGDVLILTKPIGMGILTTALKADMIDNKLIKMIISIMSELNYNASLAMQDFDVSACTDVTGFGLLGHAFEMVHDKISIIFNKEAIPVIEEAKTMANMGIIPGGTHSNKKYIGDKVDFQKRDENDIILFDAQTSGGLLISVSQDDARKLVKRLKNEGYEYSCIIAEICEKKEKSLVVI